MSALVCIKVDLRWKIYEKAEGASERPDDLGTCDVCTVEFCLKRHTGMDCRFLEWSEYPSLREALETELKMDGYEYLHIWQQGKWSTICMN